MSEVKPKRSIGDKVFVSLLSLFWIKAKGPYKVTKHTEEKDAAFCEQPRNRSLTFCYIKRASGDALPSPEPLLDNLSCQDICLFAYSSFVFNPMMRLIKP